MPNITPHPEDGIGGWSKSDITFALQTGILPDGDVLGGAMAEVIEDATSHLTADDRSAIADYLLSLPPLDDAAPRPGRRRDPPPNERARASIRSRPSAGPARRQGGFARAISRDAAPAF